MAIKDTNLIVTQDVKNLGIEVVMAIIKDANISNKSLPLEKLKKETIEKLKIVDISNNQILEGYRELYDMVGLKGFIPPAEHLIRLVKKNGRLPNINTVVDSYNIVSAETFLSIGAHDLDNIKGNVTFKVAEGNELYVPLGQSNPQKVNRGEYVCMDDEKVLCWLDIKQCEQTKITKETKSFIVYVQGNKNTDQNYLLNALMKVCENIKTFCGGTFKVVTH